MPQFVTLMVFPALMIFAALSDLFTMTISNRVSIALVAVFLAFAVMIGLSPQEIAIHLACGFGVLVLTFIMFARGWVGGGDAKLAAATAVWLGWQNIGEYGLQTALIGGALTLSILSVRQMPLPAWALRFGWISHLHDEKTGIPYGIALAIGGLMIFPDTSLWRLAYVA